MDIISHTLTGIAVGTTLATISNSDWKIKALIILTGGFGGALPDFDTISLWSSFDSTLGSFFNLNHSGSDIYFGKFWYSHHAAFHSILAPIFIISIVIIVKTCLKRNLKFSKIFIEIKTNRFFYLSFLLGFILHVLEDIPTPSSFWGGVNLFFPNSEYIGGFGKIWWWNNYDLVLIIFSVIILNLVVNLLTNRFQKLKSYISISIFSIGVISFLVQINTRSFDFSYSGYSVDYYEFETQSKTIQKEILGETLFQFMVKIDNMIPLNF